MRDNRLFFFVIPDEDDSGFPGHPVILLSKTIGPNIAVKDINIGIRTFLLDAKGILNRHGTAYAAAIGMLIIAGTYTLDHDDVFTLTFELVSVEELFQFHLGKDIFRLPVKEFAGFCRFPSRSRNDSATGYFGFGDIALTVALSFFRDRH